jgi:hypothetical protein
MADGNDAYPTSSAPTDDQCQSEALGGSFSASLGGDGGDNVTAELDGIIVLGGWASPSMPSGDSSFLPNIFVYVTSTEAAQGGYNWNVSSVSGPNVTSFGDEVTVGETDWAFPLDGTTAFDCSYLMTNSGEDSPPGSACQPQG